MGTRAAWMGSAEVVEVVFDPKTVSLERLIEIARRRDTPWETYGRDAAQCSSAGVILGRDVRPAGARRPDKDPKYYLGRTALRHVPMTEAQAVRVNASLADGGYRAFLSPRQLELLAFVERHADAEWPVAVDRGLAAWPDVAAVRAALER